MVLWYGSCILWDYFFQGWEQISKQLLLFKVFDISILAQDITRGIDSDSKAAWAPQPDHNIALILPESF